MTSALPSLPTLQPNPAWASLPLFDRTGWKRLAFGEFAESIGERAEPKDAQEEIYVGLEHLDPQCLHIRRWGKGSDVIGGKLRFRKGDVIFGKRRALLKYKLHTDQDLFDRAYGYIRQYY